MNCLRNLLVALALVSVLGCSSIRGERIETGFGPVIDQSSERQAANAASAAGPSAAQRSAAARIADLRREAATPSAVNQPVATAVGLGQGDATASFDFRATELYSGSIVEGVDLFGQGTVLATFVQPGCELSLDGGPTISEIAEAHPEAIFVIVHSGADNEAYKAFAEEAMLFQENMVHLSDTHGSLAKRYSIDAFPTTLLIDSEMRIPSVTGAMDRETQRKAVEAVTTRSGAL